MGTQEEPDWTPPLSSDAIPLPPDFRGRRHGHVCYDPEENNTSSAAVDDVHDSLFGDSSPIPPPKIRQNKKKSEDGGGEIHFDLIHEEHDFTRGPVFHCPRLFEHIEKAKRMGISVGPGAPVFIRYVPPEGHDNLPPRSSSKNGETGEATSSRGVESVQAPVMTEAEVESEVETEAALKKQMAEFMVEQMEQLLTEDTGPVRDEEEVRSPKSLENMQPTAEVTETEARAALVEERTVESTESRVAQLPTETESSIRNFGQHAREQSDGARQKADLSDPNSGQEASDRIVRTSDKEDDLQDTPPGRRSEQDKVLFKRIGKRRLQKAFPKLTPFRRMRTWAGPPPSAPSIRRKSIGGNPLPLHPVFSRPGRRNRGKSTQPGGIMKEDPENRNDIPLKSIEEASALPKGTTDDRTAAAANASSVTQPGPSAQQGASRQPSVASTVATRRSTRKTSVASAQRQPSAAPSRQGANTKRKVTKAPARAPKTLETVAEGSEGEDQDAPDDEPEGDEDEEEAGESEEEKEEEDEGRQLSAAPAQKGKRKAPAKAAGKAPAKKKAATTKSKKAAGKAPASKKAAGSKATGKTTTTTAKAAGKKPAAKTTKAGKK